VVDSYHGETRKSENVGISPAEEVWSVAIDNETLATALTCNTFQHAHSGERPYIRILHDDRYDARCNFKYTLTHQLVNHKTQLQSRHGILKSH
jgi:hypothetical protein